MQEPVVVFHGGCLDGFGSAYAAYVHFVLNQGIQPLFVAAVHGDEPPEASGRTVYVIDYAYKRQAMVTSPKHRRAG